MDSSTALLEASDWLAGLTDQPDLVRQFCMEQGIMSETEVAVRMAQRIFPKGNRCSIRLENDPETGWKTIAVEVLVQGTVDDVLKSYHCFLQEWVQSVSWPKRELIRLYYNFN